MVDDFNNYNDNDIGLLFIEQTKEEKTTKASDR